MTAPQAMPAASSVVAPSAPRLGLAALPPPVEPPPAPPPIRPRWTTSKNSNECSENSAGDTSYYQHFQTREECETWVKERSCRPGFACFDGCNWGGCDGDGKGMTQTLLGCPSLAYNFEFSPRSMDVQKEPDWAWMQEGVAEEFKAPQRRLIISGYVEPGNTEVRASAEKRALARAKLVRRKLIKHGLPAKRLVTELGDVEALRAVGYAGTLALVRVGFDPAERVREDFVPSSREYQLWCGAIPRK